MKEEVQKAILNNKTIKMVDPDLEDRYLEIEGVCSNTCFEADMM